MITHEREGAGSLRGVSLLLTVSLIKRAASGIRRA